MGKVALPAIITASASLIVAIISIVASSKASQRAKEAQSELETQKARLTGELQAQSRRLDNELEEQRIHLNNQLEERRSVGDARRDYEYEARKRLYRECEPLVFQALEQAGKARSRVVSLARSAKGGDIRPDGSGWLDRTDYYFQSTTYFLLVPTTAYKMLQRRLTAIDLRLEPWLNAQYELLKLLFLSFTDDHDLARFAPELDYRPDQADPGIPNREKLLRDHPDVFWRQGLYLGTLDIVAEALIHEAGEAPRPKSFGEFVSEFADTKTRLGELFPDFRWLFGKFHPLRNPVLWRVLATQVLLHDAILRTEQETEQDVNGLGNPPDPPTGDDLALFDWRHEPDQASDGKIAEPFLVAHQYLTDKFARVNKRLQSRSVRLGQGTKHARLR